eukprot:TRINITY_DN2443_c0_g1_i5.p1 TRINITY_DN2443_c0_g1~~TRINITY_DN2443_c0_g1_i5.p1  ORF type:complete len:568 (+),score=36.54 TRINITY_DN2443_c0_g1_i5:80-1705(+)
MAGRKRKRAASTVPEDMIFSFSIKPERGPDGPPPPRDDSPPATVPHTSSPDQWEGAGTRMGISSSPTLPQQPMDRSYHGPRYGVTHSGPGTPARRSSAPTFYGASAPSVHGGSSPPANHGVAPQQVNPWDASPLPYGHTAPSSRFAGPPSPPTPAPPLPYSAAGHRTAAVQSDAYSMLGDDGGVSHTRAPPTPAASDDWSVPTMPAATTSASDHWSSSAPARSSASGDWSPPTVAVPAQSSPAGYKKATQAGMEGYTSSFSVAATAPAPPAFRTPTFSGAARPAPSQTPTPSPSSNPAPAVHSSVVPLEGMYVVQPNDAMAHSGGGGGCRGRSVDDEFEELMRALVEDDCTGGPGILPGASGTSSRDAPSSATRPHPQETSSTTQRAQVHSQGSWPAASSSSAAASHVTSSGHSLALCRRRRLSGSSSQEDSDATEKQRDTAPGTRTAGTIVTSPPRSGSALSVLSGSESPFLRSRKPSGSARARRNLPSHIDLLRMEHADLLPEQNYLRMLRQKMHHHSVVVCALPLHSLHIRTWRAHTA